jgi:hypothetical protein
MVRKIACNFSFSSNLTDFQNSPTMKLLNENFNEIAPICFFYWPNPIKSKQMSEVLRKTFLPLPQIDGQSMNGLSILISDGIVGYPMHKLVHLISNTTQVYYFEMMGEMFNR